jgi:hypothetical protein
MIKLGSDDPEIGVPDEKWIVTPIQVPVHTPDAPFEPAPHEPTKVPEKVP